MTEISVERLIAHARALIGTRWLHQGRTVDGVDCIGFVALAARKAGVDLTRYEDHRKYGHGPSPLFLQTVQEHSQRLDAPVPGAGILLRWGTEPYPRHAAIFTERGTIIHAHARCGVVEHGYRAMWVRQTHSIWKIPGVAYEL